MSRRFYVLPFKENEAARRFKDFLIVELFNKRIRKIDLLGAEDISPIIPSKEMLLWLDVHRNNRTYRVNVHLTNNRKYRY